VTMIMQKKSKDNFNFLRKKIAKISRSNGWQTLGKLHFANNLSYSLSEILCIFLETLFHQ